jgi:protein-tyrosine-phosphatase
MRPDLNVDSAGLHVVIPVSDEAREYLKKEGAEQYLKKYPESLTDKKLETYNLIVAMQQRHKEAIKERCPSCEAKTIVWNIEDPYNMPYQDAEKIYAKIKEKVAELAKKL